MKQPIRLVVGDPSPLIREGICSLFTNEPGFIVAGHCSNGAELTELVACRQPRVVVLDPLLPGVSFPCLLSTLQSVAPHSGLLVFGSQLQARHFPVFVQQGASGCLLKESTPAELFRAVRTIAAGEPFFCRKSALQLLQVVSGCASDRSAVSFSEKEQNIIRLICAGFSNKMIAAETGLALSTVETYRKRILRKIGVANTAGLVEWAMRERSVVSSQ